MRLEKALFLLGTAALAWGAAVAQERLAGRAKVVDGDSLEIAGTGVRLFGIDAPERGQPCVRDGRAWRCGSAAAAELRRLVGSREITCSKRDEDAYGRILAICRAGNTDLGAALVRAGLALAYRRYSDDYVDEEREAKAARRGVWSGEFTDPEEWRRRDSGRTGGRGARGAQQATANDATEGRRDGCYIKGNINGDGERIYHTPDSLSYRDTEIDLSRGERWFCTEEEARRAGWRAPRGR
jgi:endonuclease YncB( thermonuclease family)